MSHFYESTFFEVVPSVLTGDPVLFGWRVLTSPPAIYGKRISYDGLLQDLATDGHALLSSTSNWKKRSD